MREKKANCSHCRYPDATSRCRDRLLSPAVEIGFKGRDVLAKDVEPTSGRKSIPEGMPHGRVPPAQRPAECHEQAAFVWQLEDLHHLVSQKLEMLDKKKVSMLEKKLELQNKVASALDSHLQALLDPVNAQRSALLDMLKAAEQLLEQAKAVPAGTVQQLPKKADQQHQLQALIQSWRALSTLPLSACLPSMEEVVCMAVGDTLQQDQPALRQDSSSAEASNSSACIWELEQQSQQLQLQLQAKEVTIQKMNEAQARLQSEIAALHETLRRLEHQNQAPSVKHASGPVAVTGLTAASPQRQPNLAVVGMQQLRSSLGLPSGSLTPQQDDVMPLGAGDDAAKMKDAYRRMLLDLQARSSAEASRARSKHAQELQQQEHKHREAVLHLEQQQKHWQEQTEALKCRVAQLEAQLRKYTEPQDEKTGPTAVPADEAAGSHVNQPENEQTAAASSVSYGPCAGAPPLTLESLSSLLSELSQARETEARVQLYRLQDQHEAKLESMQKCLQQQELEHLVVLQQLRELRQQLGSTMSNPSQEHSRLKASAYRGDTTPTSVPSGIHDAPAALTDRTNHEAACPQQAVGRKAAQFSMPIQDSQYPGPRAGAHRGTGGLRQQPSRQERHVTSQQKMQARMPTSGHSPGQAQGRSHGLNPKDMSTRAQQGMSHSQHACSSPGATGREERPGQMVRSPASEGSCSVSFRGMLRSQSPTPAARPSRLLPTWEGLAAGTLQHGQGTPAAAAAEHGDGSSYQGFLGSITDDMRVCARCGLNDNISPGLCAFHPALIPDPGPLLFGPEWHSCDAAGHSMEQPPCFQRWAHTYPDHILEDVAAAAVSGDGGVSSSPAPQPRKWLPAPLS